MNASFFSSRSGNTCGNKCCVTLRSFEIRHKEDFLSQSDTNMEPVSLSDTGFIFVWTLFRCFCHFAIPGRLFLVVAALLCCFTGGEALKDRSEKVTYAGETVILPCHLTVDNDNDVPSVEWSKEGLSPNIVFLYRDGCETFAEKNPAYRYRTNLIMNELKNGNLSLRISDVQLSDAGKYTCKTFQKRPLVVATVELFVGAVSEPKLSVVPGGEGGVTLQCDVNGWFPQPEITFLNAQRNITSDGDTKIYQDHNRRCFNATRRLTVQTADRVTCRVHQPKINQTRVTEIDIPGDCVRSCTTATIIAVVVTMIICGVLCAAALLWKKRHILVEHKLLSPQFSHQSSTRSNAEGHHQAEPNQNATELLRTIDALKSNLHVKDKTIQRLTEELNDLKTKQSPVVCQHGLPTLVNNSAKSSQDTSLSLNLPPDQFPHDNNPQPAASTNSNHRKSGSLPRKTDSRPGVSELIPASGPQIQRSRNNSSPALLTNSEAESPGAASPSDETCVGRSMSMSESHPRPNAAKPQRRATMSCTSNRFSVLANLPEDDAEPLLHGK